MSERGTVSTPQRPAQQPHYGRQASPVVATAAYWVVPVLRAIPALLVGLIIAFSEDHSARVGLTWFGVFAVVSGAVLLAGGLRTVTDRVVRGVFVAEAVIAVISGAAALLLMS